MLDFVSLACMASIVLVAWLASCQLKNLKFCGCPCKFGIRAWWKNRRLASRQHRDGRDYPMRAMSGGVYVPSGRGESEVIPLVLRERRLGSSSSSLLSASVTARSVDSCPVSAGLLSSVRSSDFDLEDSVGSSPVYSPTTFRRLAAWERTPPSYTSWCVSSTLSTLLKVRATLLGCLRVEIVEAGNLVLYCMSEGETI